MTNAISINIGLNYVNPDSYNGWDGALSGCVNDALSMQKIADNLGYVSTLILNEEATADRIISEIGQAAWNLDENGILLLTYSGHGGQMPDVNGDESDGKDETWVMYDRQLIDDELYNLWNQFRSGARIVVLSDSCHSGTVTRNREYLSVTQSDIFARHYQTRSGPPRFRGIPTEVAAGNYQENKAQYDALQFASGSRTRSMMDACVLLISGCQDNQLSNDGDANGLFTGTLLNVWRNGGFSGSYKAFHQAILDQMPSTQTPNYYLVGTSNPEFEGQTPFTVDAPSVMSITPTVPASPWPSIKGRPTIPRIDSPPSFAVNAGPGRSFAVELAAAANLFDGDNHGKEQNSNNFYASWSDTAFMQGSSYTLPLSVWERLRGNSRLYYRIYSNNRPDEWDNYQLSSGDTDGESIPAIQING
jgi:metacaspase-1